MCSQKDDTAAVAMPPVEGEAEVTINAVSCNLIASIIAIEDDNSNE